MKKVYGIIALIIVMSFISCTENVRVRQWGGSQTITLEPNERLVNLTWKEVDLWVLTKIDSTPPATYTFKEKSSFGVMEGTIIVVEK